MGNGGAEQRRDTGGKRQGRATYNDVKYIICVNFSVNPKPYRPTLSFTSKPSKPLHMTVQSIFHI